MANETMRDYWSSESGTSWIANRTAFDAELAPFADAVLTAANIAPSERVLDVGCGTGELARLAVEQGAHVVGVDISAPMVEAAREHIPGAEFRVADAQTESMAGDDPFDVVMSRFGVMFFDDPAAAFANLASASRPGGRLAFACWRSRAENAIFSVGTDVILAMLDSTPVGPVDNQPGPLGLADPDRIEAILSAEAAWGHIAIRPFDAVLDYGFDGTDGVENRLAMILGSRSSNDAREQLLPQIGESGWAGVVADVRRELQAYVTDGTLQLSGATWIVTARRM